MAGKAVERVGQLAVVFDVLFNSYVAALAETDLSQPELEKNALPGELLEMSNVVQVTLDTQRREAAKELLANDAEQLRKLWESLGFGDRLVDRLIEYTVALSKDRLRYGQEG